MKFMRWGEVLVQHGSGELDGGQGRFMTLVGVLVDVVEKENFLDQRDVRGCASGWAILFIYLFYPSN